LVTKDEILAALATVPVTTLSLLTIYKTKFYGWTIGVGEMFGHHVPSKCEIGRTYSKFGRTMSDDRLLFPALLYFGNYVPHLLHQHQHQQV